MILDRGVVSLVLMFACGDGTFPAQEHPVVQASASSPLLSTVSSVHSMSLALVCRSLISMDFRASQCGRMDTGHPPSPTVTSNRYTDWILIPDICEPVSTCKSPGIAIVPINAGDIISPSPRRPDRPRPKFKEELDLFCEDHNTQTVGLIDNRRPGSTSLSGQTLPNRPSPRRLPTPDLPDIDKQEFWPSLEYLESLRGSFEGEL